MISYKGQYKKQKTRDFRKHRKGTAKVTPKVEKPGYDIFTENISLSGSSVQVVAFCNNALIF